LKSIASAPGKIILFGEHFVVHGTKAILAAIDKRVTVTSSFTNNKTIKVNSQLGSIEVPISSSHEEVEHRLLYNHKTEFRPFVYLANKIINSEQNASGLEITIDSDIPIGVGLGSSSACCVAAAGSIFGLFKELSSEEILNLSIEAEKTIFPDTSGADCTVCTYGGMIEYPSIEKIDNPFDFALLIANSMIPHSTKRSVEKVNKFKENNEERFSQLCDLETKLIDEVIADMKNNNPNTVRLAMSLNQEYLEEIQVSNEKLREMMRSLQEDPLCLHPKITGAGDGGCVIALVAGESINSCLETVRKKFTASVWNQDKECFSAKIDTKGVVWSTIEE